MSRSESLRQQGRRRLNPERAFPAEVLALRAHGVPPPTWYCGPLYTATLEDERRALVLLDAARTVLPVEDGDEEAAG